MTLLERDLAAVWHPATHFDDESILPPIPLVRAQGPWLEAEDGRRFLDAISSWWTCLHGHGHPQILAAMRKQAGELDHVMFAGFTHEAAVNLAEGLIRAAGPEFGRVFFADSGADAIEVALKMSLQSHQQTGGPGRRRFAALARGYHGETLGALGVCGNELYRDRFAHLLHDALFLPAPCIADHQHRDLVEAQRSGDHPETAAALALLEAHAHELAAVILEPLVQCAGQMAMTGVGFVRAVTERAQALGIHVIADEVAVGLGRTGRMFAWQWSGRAPEFLVLGKALSGGVLPLSAVVVRRGLDDGFRGQPGRSFAHSHTYCANPIACAAGVASLELLQREVLPSLAARIDAFQQAAAGIATMPGVRAQRQTGCIVAFDLSPTRHYPRLGLTLRRAALARGVLLRPLGETVYWMPPLNLGREELALLTRVTAEVIAEVAT